MSQQSASRPRNAAASGGAQVAAFHIVGHVAARPEIFESAGGKRGVSLLLDSGAGVVAVPVTCWGAMADRAAGFRPGLLVEASGSLRPFQSTKRDGTPFHGVGLTAQSLVKLDTPGGR